MKKYTPKNCLFKDDHATQNSFDGLCFCCGLKTGPSYQERLDAEIESVPKELKQKFVTSFVEGKLSLGEAIDLIDPEKKYERSTWYTILSKQIEFVGYERIKPVVE